jgi:RNA polymerase sigma-70 factor (ECF subfamily)
MNTQGSFSEHSAEKCSLLDRLRGGESHALSDLYDTYGRLVYVIISRIVNNPAVAEDLVQDTFFRAWNHAGSLSRDYDSVGPWLLRIAKHSALDYLKSPQSRVAAIKVTDRWVAPISIEGDLLVSEQARILAGACRTLTANQRRVIEMAYYRGLSQSEIAAELNQSLGTVKAWTRIALRRLREKLDRSLTVTERRRLLARLKQPPPNRTRMFRKAA